MLASSFIDGANDVITAVLVIAVGAVLRGLWSLQQRLARLEGLDEQRERHLNKDRDDEPAVRSSGDHLGETKEDA
jgi:hypothetical protein